MHRGSAAQGGTVQTTLDSVWTWQDEATTYRGPDRRRTAVARAAQGSYKLFGCYLVVGQLVVAGTFLAGVRWGGGAPTEADWITASVAVISALAAVMFAVWWRLVGDATALWIASALTVYAAVNIVFPDLLRPFADTDAEITLVSVLRPASVIVVMGLLVIGAASPRVDAGLTGRRALRWAVVIAAIATAVAARSVDMRVVFGPAMDVVPSDSSTAIGQIGVGGAWLALGVAFLVRAKRDWDAIDGWIAVLLICLAEARLALAMSVHDPAWLLASQVGRLVGVSAALIGILHELQRSFVLQRGRLLSSDAELTITRTRQATERALAEERAHDVRSALAGIGSATVTLERHHDDLSAEERATLARSVAAEIARLQQIVADDGSDRSRVHVASVLEPVITCARVQGMDVRADLAPDISVWASASELAEVVQNLLDNARRHAPDAPVDIRARQTGDRVDLEVCDAGPGIDPAIGGQVFERGVHGGAPGSSGLGLYVAARLARANGGDLRVATGEDGGACFTLSLPSVTPEVR
jgi:signal transduction histidine kinase